MSWSVRQTRRFARIYKKLHDNAVAEVDAAIETVAQNPEIGEKKKGDLSDLWVYKFRCLGQLYLLGYTRDDGIRLVYLEAVGPHEDFYRDLKRSGKRDVEGLARTGLHKGVLQGEALALQRMFTRRFGPLPEWAAR